MLAPMELVYHRGLHAMKYNYPPIRGNPVLTKEIQAAVTKDRKAVKRKGRYQYRVTFICRHRELLRVLADRAGQSQAAFLNGLIAEVAERKGISV